MEVFCESRGNRTGFYHRATLIHNGEKLLSTKVQYYNRTWEAHQFDTVKSILKEKACKKYPALADQIKACK